MKLLAAVLLAAPVWSAPRPDTQRVSSFLFRYLDRKAGFEDSLLLPGIPASSVPGGILLDISGVGRDWFPTDSAFTRIPALSLQEAIQSIRPFERCNVGRPKLPETGPVFSHEDSCAKASARVIRIVILDLVYGTLSKAFWRGDPPAHAGAHSWVQENRYTRVAFAPRNLERGPARIEFRPELVYSNEPDPIAGIKLANGSWQEDLPFPAAVEIPDFDPGHLLFIDVKLRDGTTRQSYLDFSE